MRGRLVVLSLIMLVLGFLVSFSYQLTKEQRPNNGISSEQWSKEYETRQLLIKQEERNTELQKELFKSQEKVREIEENLKNEKQIYFNLVEDVEKYRMYVGELGVAGEGIEVTLEDSSYIPEGENVNNYIVHEGHIFKVINELLISGASAIAINGQRLSHDSYIYCNGPVVTVDGNQFPAPFVISAIGEPAVLDQALNIAGGIVEQIAYDNIVITLEKKSEIKMNPLLQEKKS
ncbi:MULTISPECIES: DUF881 domain-containing protein [Metabacillus]|uniref:DUF881 domain-containing protein n=1 Tax=Metabacillus hrfriensis TaxID=3048891 RepID=A0ACD4RIM7_9BACI|nr:MULTISPECIES: DUF881 domain-containing protein [Metabacillus]UAL54690.1 DUF881 domain-containing protein [Metabacillus dongyingensis]USK30992.1 DUF881 domain-containing protein [Bacillus sp. CMF21]WHZ60226.1 DUF881 domain-containing protein [Metabacillus sp. CT-WN-B3]